PTAVTGITGENGVGKTNLLDAVYYLCFTKSYFQNKEINNVQHGLSGFRIEGTWDNEDNTSEMLSHTVCKWKDGRKVVSENDLEYEKITDHIGKYTAVMIAPDDVTLINDSSEQRRKVMDGLLAQSQPEYLQHLLAYQKVLSQRNACLKMVSPNHNLLDVYDQTLAKHGLVLIKARQRLAEEFPELVQTVYSRLSAGKELVTLQYRSSAQPDALLNALTKSRARDLEAKRTLQGPHTEDWIFCIDGHLLKNQASQGQKKSFLIGLKLAQLKWLQSLGKTPI